MQIEFVTDGLLVPGSRFRCEQFFTNFEAAGIRCKLKYAYGALYNTAINKPWGPLYKLACRVRRGAAQILPDKATDIVFLQRTAFPQSSIFEEILSRRGIPLVFDFDDSLFLNASGVESRARRLTFERATSLASHLIAGNEFLSAEAGHPEKTTVIPTVIDAVRYVPAPKTEGAMIIGWMGTAGNFPFLERTVPALKTALQRYPNARFRLVSNADFKPLLGHPQVEQIRWSADAEISLLQSFDIGLMPLVDSPLTRGKCAFKMIQYMAVGRPVVVSEVGANVDVFGDGTNPPGRMLSSFDWEDALSELIEDAALRQAMGERGRERVEQHYSIDAVLPQYLQIFNSLVR